MKVAIGIFAKTIGFSPIKTRLAANIGQARAEAFYRLSVACIARMISMTRANGCEIRPYWVLAEERGPDHFEHQDFPRLWTDNGGLGTRLANVSQTLFHDHDCVIMMGTDSPQLSNERMAEAIDPLKDGKTVVGPATDGGFYLFGSSHPVPRQVWEGVNYSVDTTLMELRKALVQTGMTLCDLPAEQDVDEIEDFVSLKKNLREKGGKRTTQQSELLHWLEQERLGLPGTGQKHPQ